MVEKKSDEYKARYAKYKAFVDGKIKEYGSIGNYLKARHEDIEESTQKAKEDARTPSVAQ